MRQIWLAAMTTLAIGTAAMAAEPAAHAGRWDIAGDKDGDPACTGVLLTGPTIGGYEISLPKTCLTAFPILGDVSAWRIGPSGAVVFANPVREAVLTFEPVDDGAYVARAQDDRGYVLIRAAPLKPVKKPAKKKR